LAFFGSAAVVLDFLVALVVAFVYFSAAFY